MGYVDGRICPRCESDDFHHHSLSWWCMACGWQRHFDKPHAPPPWFRKDRKR